MNAKIPPKAKLIIEQMFGNKHRRLGEQAVMAAIEEKDAEIANLKQEIQNKDAEIERLTTVLNMHQESGSI